MNDKYELLPCPFCGSDEARLLLPTCTKDSKYNPADRAFPSVFCINCFVSIPGRDWDHSGNSAIAAWNRRTEQVRETGPVMTGEMIEAVQRIRETAMRWTLVARIPECAEFSGIAQDAGWLLSVIREDGK